MVKHDNDNGSISSRLKLAREMAGLTQGQVAKLLQLHRPTISEMEAGRRKVAADELRQLSDIYDVSIAWMMGMDEEDSIDADDRVKLAARELAKFRDEDLDRILQLLRTLRSPEASE